MFFQVWKQKGEEYRVHGNGGWLWVSATRNYRLVPQDTVGLRGLARRLRVRHSKEMSKKNKINEDEKNVVGKEGVEDSMDVGGSGDGPVQKEAGGELKVDGLVQNKEEGAGDSVVKKDEDVKMDESGDAPEQKGNGDEVGSGLGNEKKGVDEVRMDGSGDGPVQKESPEEEMSLETDTEVKEKEKDNESMDIDEEKKQADSENSTDVAAKSLSSNDVGEKDQAENGLEEKQGDDKIDKNEDSLYFPSGLKKKVDVDLIDVSAGLLNRTVYPKVTKPYAKLDSLLDRRQKQLDVEQKQKFAIEQVCY